MKTNSIIKKVHEVAEYGLDSIFTSRLSSYIGLSISKIQIELSCKGSGNPFVDFLKSVFELDCSLQESEKFQKSGMTVFPYRIDKVGQPLGVFPIFDSEEEDFIEPFEESSFYESLYGLLYFFIIFTEDKKENWIFRGWMIWGLDEEDIEVQGLSFYSNRFEGSKNKVFFSQDAQVYLRKIVVHKGFSKNLKTNWPRKFTNLE